MSDSLIKLITFDKLLFIKIIFYILFAHIIRIIILLYYYSKMRNILKEIVKY